MSPGLALDVLEGRLAVCRLPPDAPLADWMWTGPVASATRTEAELSVVCGEWAVPEGVSREGGWRALRVRGPLAFETTGVLASLAGALAAADVPLFALSTFDTDVLLVREGDVEIARVALRSAGHEA